MLCSERSQGRLFPVQAWACERSGYGWRKWCLWHWAGKSTWHRVPRRRGDSPEHPRGRAAGGVGPGSREGRREFLSLLHRKRTPEERGVGRGALTLPRSLREARAGRTWGWSGGPFPACEPWGLPAGKQAGSSEKSPSAWGVRRVARWPARGDLGCRGLLAARSTSGPHS